jgi:hypothetical protein
MLLLGECSQCVVPVVRRGHVDAADHLTPVSAEVEHEGNAHLGRRPGGVGKRLEGVRTGKREGCGRRREAQRARR